MSILEAIRESPNRVARGECATTGEVFHAWPSKNGGAWRLGSGLFVTMTGILGREAWVQKFEPRGVDWFPLMEGKP